MEKEGGGECDFVNNDGKMIFYLEDVERGTMVMNKGGGYMANFLSHVAYSSGA